MIKIVSFVIATLLLTGAAPAYAEQQGFAACSMVSAAQSKVFYSNPLPASKSTMNGMDSRYVQMLRDKRYSNTGLYDPPSTPPPTLKGACSLYVSEAAATEALGHMRQDAAKQGLNELLTPFEG